MKIGRKLTILEYFENLPLMSLCSLNIKFRFLIELIESNEKQSITIKGGVKRKFHEFQNFPSQQKSYKFLCKMYENFKILM